MLGVSFLIVNYHAAESCCRLVESIAQHMRHREYEILIHDNSQDAGELKKLKTREDSGVQIRSAVSNIGFVAATNELFRQARYGIIAVLNPDSLIIDDSLESLFSFLEGSQGMGVSGPMLLNEDRSYQVSFYKFPTLVRLAMEHIFLWPGNVYAYRTSPFTQQQCDVVKGACLVVRRDSILTEYIFDPDLVMYSEEVDLCLRLHKSGRKNLYFPSARIVHYGEESSRRTEVSEYVLYHYYRSKLILFRKHYSRFAYVSARVILLISLVEKVILLRLALRSWNSTRHFHTLRRLWREHMFIGGEGHA